MFTNGGSIPRRVAIALTALVLGGYPLLDRPPPTSTAWVEATTPSPAPTVPVPPVPDPAAGIRATLVAYLKGRGHAGLAVTDRVTGVTVTYQESSHFNTASVAKLDILSALLWQAGQAGRRLTPAQRDLAEDMITRSDNDAADELWESIGGAAGLARANRVFGLRETIPGANGYWGLTSTTAADQVRLLGVLVDPAGPLPAASRAYALGLLGRVRPDQRWGVPRAAGPAATAAYVKNGWLARPGKGLWIINSVGRIVEPGHDWLVAVLSDHHSSQRAGITVVEHLAALAVDGLRGA